MNRAPATGVLEQARRSLVEGRFDAAASAFGHVLQQDPDHVEALNGAAVAALKGGQAPRALELLEHAARIAPSEPFTFNNLGQVHEASGNLEAALKAFERAVALNPELDIARLYQAGILERLGQRRTAALAYLRAVRHAQAKGRWLNAATTPGALRTRVEQAMRYIVEVQLETFSAVLEPLVARFGGAELDRVEQSLRIYVGLLPPPFTDPRQRPTFLFFPGLGATPYFARERFGWIDAYEQLTPVIRDELMRVLPSTEGREAVFADPRLAQQNLRGERGPAGWDGYYFYRYGTPNAANGRSCPRTLAAIEDLPLARVPGNAPEVMFSVLSPGTHLLPHRGVTNTRLVSHLPLVVPPDCALRVGGETHAWAEGRAVVFDDTYEHEAWNRSTQTRVVLIADVWHPDLSEAERAAVAALAEAISGFRLAAERL